MKILFLLTQSLDYPSGLGRYRPLARELARLGHQVSVAALHPALRSVHNRVFDDCGVRVHYVGPMHVRQEGSERHYYGPLNLGWAVMRATWGLAQRAVGEGADVVHVGKPHPMNGLAGLLAQKLRKCRLYLDCDDYEAGSNRFSADWQKQVVTMWEDRLPRHARGVTTNTRFTQKRLEGLGIPPGRIVYVPNGIDRQRFAPPPAGLVAYLRRYLNPSGAPLILYVGSLSRASHALELLLDAFAQIAVADAHIRLLLVGGGEDYRAIQQLVAESGLADRVLMTGRVEPDQVPAYYRLGDLSVDPVHDDAAARGRSPIKLFESMAMGTPVVTGDVGDRFEYLSGGAAGLLVEPGSARALAEGILHLLHDPNRLRSMAETGQDLAESYYWDIQVHKFLTVYEY